MDIKIVLALRASQNKMKAIAIHLFAAGLSEEEVLEMLIGVGIFKWGIKEQVERQVNAIKEKEPKFQDKDLDSLVLWTLFRSPVGEELRGYFRKVVQEAFTFYCSHKAYAS